MHEQFVDESIVLLSQAFTVTENEYQALKLETPRAALDDILQKGLHSFLLRCALCNCATVQLCCECAG
jgi:hypothetical protein